jgi:hypothetical protein
MAEFIIFVGPSNHEFETIVLFEAQSMQEMRQAVDQIVNIHVRAKKQFYAVVHEINSGTIIAEFVGGLIKKDGTEPKG